MLVLGQLDKLDRITHVQIIYRNQSINQGIKHRKYFGIMVRVADS